jgi:hypothetical protein
MEQQLHGVWTMGESSADVWRDGSRVTVQVHGVLTAQVYEALHRRMAAERGASLRLVLGDDVLLAVTSQSAAEAAARGTPASRAAATVLIGVPPRRRNWALEHCALMAQIGLSRAAYVLPAQPPAAAGA